MVTIAGGKELEEPVVVRPTSETVIGEFMAKWVQSYRDLPLLLNQWANVVRWELRPRLFLRTSEFLWQEGHTAHATQADARAYATRIHREVYEDFMVNVLAMPVIVGMKTARERFAGADTTLTLEGMMGDGKALQMATSHELGQNFARAFGIEFLDDNGAQQTAWTTSWGSSTRMVGGLIMAHGDDDGLRIPPRLAPVQVVVLAVRDEGEVVERCAKLADELRAAGVRVQLDTKTDVSMGRRATDWELKGVPVRLEVGPRDLADGVATLVRRLVSKTGTAARTARRSFRSTASPPRSPPSSNGNRPHCSTRPLRCASHTPPTSPRSTTRVKPRPPGSRASRGTPSASRAKPSSRRRACPSGACAAPTAHCPSPTTRPASSRSWRVPTDAVPDRAAGVAHARQAGARAAGERRQARRSALRTEVGRLPCHRVPRR